MRLRVVAAQAGWSKRRVCRWRGHPHVPESLASIEGTPAQNNRLLTVVSRGGGYPPRVSARAVATSVPNANESLISVLSTV